jgi:hypothetical protein
MSLDIAIWYTEEPLGDKAAGELYSKVIQGDSNLLEPNASILAFYRDLVARFPEIDDVPADKLGDTTFCPWSCKIEKTPAYILVSCVFSAAEVVGDFLGTLQEKHGLSLFLPIEGKEYHVAN